MTLGYLKNLVETPGIPGHEERIRDFILREFKRYTKDVRIDRLGNVVAEKRGSGKLKLMLSAHMDQIGFLITHIDKKGYLRFSPVGGFDERTLNSQRVVVHGERDLFGVIGSKPIHKQEPEEQKKVKKQKELFIDIGVKDRKDAERYVRIGDFVSIERSFENLLNGNVTCRGFDDRAGVAVLFETLKNLREHEANLYFLASTQEEVGLRGAKVASFSVTPDIGIATEVTFATHPDLEPFEVSCELSKGPAIAIGPNIHPKIFRMLRETAEENRIPYQIDVDPMPYGTDASVIQLTKAGVATGIVSVPLRYMHTSCEVVNIEDIENTGILIARFAERLEDGVDLSL